MTEALHIDAGAIADLLTRGPGAEAARIRIDPDTVKQDLAKLILGLMECLRQLMELQAIRRMEAGSLTEDQEERLGTTLMRAETAIHEVAAQFGLSPEDLAIDLGPLGRTI
ncbi:gas vesicle protein [Roseivivax halodurans JCM 10272]|uniref:Gas vesicle protein n=1 Tax=Roseivivax halodurans JCM 10272 TaxID=1449350 RepID=X7EL46_9RHOB|nr:gas vesicle protein K [Roseivivax halodurans]ETX15863.1 gas vesicle protein [Roseivivax halodurans JCM 10272]